MQPEELKQGYGGTWGEYPYFQVPQWQCEVANGETREGYWQWVADKIKAALP